MYVKNNISERRQKLWSGNSPDQQLYNLDRHLYQWNERIDNFGNRIGYWSYVEPLLRRRKSGVIKDARITPIAPATGASDKAMGPWETAVQIFGGRVVDPKSFPFSQSGFQSYLDATGVKYFSSKEMTMPHRVAKANKAGFSILLPPYKWWPRGAALAKLADILRNLVNRPVRMRNWWRPTEYNQLVGGAKNSDHIPAKGIDLDYQNRGDRRKAEKFLMNFRKQNPWIQMSLGLGARTTHIGLLTKRGERTWTYKSYER